MKYMNQTVRLAVIAAMAGLFVAPVVADDAATSPAKSHAVLYLANGPKSKFAWNEMPGLEREIYRQGLLIAARDGLGLETRDQSLREWSKAPPAGATWTFTADAGHVKISNAAGTVIWHEDLKPFKTFPEILDLIAKVESLSRGKFVDLLKANGFSGASNAKKPAGGAPDDVAARIDRLDELSLFAALRQTHGLMRADGESEARLGLLARGYANLGQLTRFHWGIDHDVFTARSLLYAQRMVKNDPKSAVALWRRAYAMALAGWQGQALRDLAAAKQLGGGLPPAWAPMLEPFCRYDLRKLLDLATANPKQAPLAMYLAFLTVEHSKCLAATLNTEEAALQLNQRCLRVVDAMCNVTGPGLLNQLVDVGPRILSDMLGNELELTPGLPKSVLEKIHELKRPGGNPQGREILCQVLIDSGAAQKDSGEPSWAALGRDIQETTFAHVRRKADLIALQWGVDASGFVGEIQPLIAGHPFKGVIDAYGACHELTRAHLDQAVKSVPLGNLTSSETPLYWLADMSEPPHAHTRDEILSRIDHDQFDGFDNEISILFYDADLRNRFLAHVMAELRVASPQSPWVTCSDIVNHWDAKKALDWEQSHGGYPTIQLVLSKKYVELRQWDDAERCLESYIKVSPDLTGYESLAGLYWSQHKEALWLSTLKAFLANTQAVSLEHARVQSQIAHYYMALGQFAEALPYADAAAGTGAAWGLQCAAEAHTGVGDFDRAEALYIEDYRHYSTSPYLWYSWCVRTGHGHRDDAVRALQDYFKSRGGHLSEEDLLQESFVDVLDGKTADAVAALQQRFQRFPGPLSLVHLMVFASDAGDAAVLNDAVNKAKTLHGSETDLNHFAAALAKGYAAGPDAPLDLKAIDALALKSGPPDRIVIDYLTAKYLDKQGHKDLAATYVKRCYIGFAGYAADKPLVDQLARELGLHPMRLANPKIQAVN